jgi:glycosyltransferase involved in cell wall biosynthesis
VDAGNGIIHVLVDLAIEQRRRGHQVAAAAGRGAFAEFLQQHGVDSFTVPQAGPRNAALAVFRLASLVRRYRPDIVHAHMVAGALAARVAIIGSRSRLITHVHNSWQRQATLMRVGHRVIAVSEAVRKDMIQRGIPAHRITTVTNGPLGSERARRAVPEPPITLTHPNVVTVAGLYERKGIGDLLEALAELRRSRPEVRLYLVGDGPDRPTFEAQASRLGLGEAAVFLGFRRDVQPLLRQADVFVLASRADPNPLVLAEAQAAGCAIVATAVDGIPEALDGGRAGLLIPPWNPAALADAVSRVLHDTALRSDLQRAAAEGLDRLQVSRMTTDVLKVYRSVLGRRG